MLLFQYRSDFPSSIKEHAVFVDMAPRFHLMAEEILQKQIQLILYNLKEVQSSLKCVHHLNLTSARNFRFLFFIFYFF
jgi:hypothetical protein